MLTLWRTLARGRQLQRRRLLQAGGAGLLGLSLPRLLQAEEVSAPGQGRAKSVIFLFLFGGPSQLETFDLKPEAPAEIRGPLLPIACRTPELRISEALPRLAAISDKFCVVRTMSHDYNDHSGAGHFLQTGKRWHLPIGGGFSATPQDWPSVGSVTEYLAQQQPGGLDRDLPSYMVVPNRLGTLEAQGQYVRPGEYAGWLGRAYNPLTTSVAKRDSADNPYWRDCTDEELTFPIAGLASGPEITLDRLGDRRDLLAQFDAQRSQWEDDRASRTFNQFRRRALSLVTSLAARVALDITQEPAATRDLYGRHLFGQSCLVARRLVEAGVRFVTVHYETVDGYSWDSHVHSNDVRDRLCPTFDQACAGLLSDLDERGLLAETLVVAVGEMGRTPGANATWGRGHWSTLFPALLAGAGVRGGAVYGSSDKHAAYARETPVAPPDLAATLYTALGIDPEVRLTDAVGRQVPAVDGGSSLTAIFG